MNRRLAIYTIILTALSMGVMCGARTRVKASTHQDSSEANIDYVYYETRIIDGVKYEKAKVERTDTLKELNLRDSLVQKVLYRYEKMLRIDNADTLVFVIPLDDYHTHFAICGKDYLSKQTNTMNFAGYYHSGKYTFLIEKSICNDIGTLGTTTKRIRYNYSWGNLSEPYPFDPLVYYVTKNYNGTAYIVSGVPVYQRGHYRVIY